MRNITLSQAVNEALAEEMRRDETVFIIGEDVAEAGTPFKVLSGLVEEFGTGRVIDTPIAEPGFMGMAVGAAMTGARPVVEGEVQHPLPQVTADRSAASERGRSPRRSPGRSARSWVRRHGLLAGATGALGMGEQPRCEEQPEGDQRERTVSACHAPTPSHAACRRPASRRTLGEFHCRARGLVTLRVDKGTSACLLRYARVYGPIGRLADRS